MLKPEIDNDAAMLGPEQITAVADFAEQGGGLRRGTIAERGAAAAEINDGDHWQDTDGDKREWVSFGSSWIQVGGTPVTFTPSATGFAGETVMYAKLSVAQGRCFVEVGFLLGVGGSWTDPTLAFPVTVAAWLPNLAPLGTVMFYDQTAGVSGRHAGVAYKTTGGARFASLQSSGGSVLQLPATGAQPFTATNLDELHAQFSFPIV